MIGRTLGSNPNKPLLSQRSPLRSASELHHRPRPRGWRCARVTAAMAAQDRPEVLVTCRSSEAEKDLKDCLSGARLSLDDGAVAVPVYAAEQLQAQPNFNAAAFQRRLQWATLGSTLLSAAALPSTQVLLQNNARALPDGIVCVADTQYQGKGRGGNTWTSPPGCLMFSLLTRLQIDGTRLPFIQYVVSLGLVQAIRTETQQLLNAPGLEVQIKWPNDLYYGTHKLGGILCQSVYRDKQFQVVIGVGLNVANEEPSTCINAILRELFTGSKDSAPVVSAEALLARTLMLLEAHVRVLCEQGFGPLERDYTDSWLHTGQEVTLEGGAGQENTVVRIQGLTPEGYLLAADAGGQRYSLSPDGNSLDFFKGLIKTKLPR